MLFESSSGFTRMGSYAIAWQDTCLFNVVIMISIAKLVHYRVAMVKLNLQGSID